MRNIIRMYDLCGARKQYTLNKPQSSFSEGDAFLYSQHSLSSREHSTSKPWQHILQSSNRCTVQLIVSGYKYCACREGSYVHLVGLGNRIRQLYLPTVRFVFRLPSLNTSWTILRILSANAMHFVFPTFNEQPGIQSFQTMAAYYSNRSTAQKVASKYKYITLVAMFILVNLGNRIELTNNEIRFSSLFEYQHRVRTTTTNLDD